MGRLASLRDPLGQTWQYAYDTRGRLSQTTSPDGGSLTRTYDAASNLTRQLSSDGTDLQFTYDALNRLTAANDLRLTYDAEGRVTETEDAGIGFGASYDAAGRLQTVTYDNGAFTVTYTYDPATGLLMQVSDSLTGTQVTFTYDPDFRLTTIGRSNGVTTTLTWDGAGRLTRFRDGTFLDLQYTLDAAGQVTQVQMTAPLDPASFMSPSSSFTYDAASQVNSPGVSHDARGRLTASPAHRFTWDGASRLVGIDDVTLTYNGLGELRTRTEGGATTHYFSNYALGLAPLVAEQDEASGTLPRFYVWTPGGALLYMIDAAAGTRVSFYHYDRTGSTLALTDETGTVTDAYAYDPYGRLLAHEGTNPQPFTFVGRLGVRQEDPGGTLYHMRARYYDAGMQRFLSREPLWPQLANPMQLNPYQYARHDPVRTVDPTGLQDSWQEINPANAPPPRIGHTMVELTGDVYLFGGQNAADGLVNDLWMFASDDWSQVTPPASPPPAQITGQRQTVRKLYATHIQDAATLEKEQQPPLRERSWEEVLAELETLQANRKRLELLARQNPSRFVLEVFTRKPANEWEKAFVNRLLQEEPELKWSLASFQMYHAFVAGPWDFPASRHTQESWEKRGKAFQEVQEAMASWFD